MRNVVSRSAVSDLVPPSPDHRLEISGKTLQPPWWTNLTQKEKDLGRTLWKRRSSWICVCVCIPSATRTWKKPGDGKKTGSSRKNPVFDDLEIWEVWMVLMILIRSVFQILQWFPNQMIRIWGAMIKNCYLVDHGWLWQPFLQAPLPRSSWVWDPRHSEASQWKRGCFEQGRCTDAARWAGTWW